MKRVTIYCKVALCLYFYTLVLYSCYWHSHLHSHSHFYKQSHGILCHNKIEKAPEQTQSGLIMSYFSMLSQMYTGGFLFFSPSWTSLFFFHQSRRIARERERECVCHRVMLEFFGKPRPNIPSFAMSKEIKPLDARFVDTA